MQEVQESVPLVMLCSSQWYIYGIFWEVICEMKKKWKKKIFLRFLSESISEIKKDEFTLLYGCVAYLEI